MMAETPQTANYISETDFLAEAGAILRGETRKIVTIEHLNAVAQLVREAEVLFHDENDPTVGVRDWLREAGKVL